MIVSKKIVAALKEIYHPGGYSILQNGGEFNDMGYYHMHIFPRYAVDGFGWTYSSEEKAVNIEIAERISKSMNMYTVPEYRIQGIAIRTLDLLVKDAREQGVLQIALEVIDMGQPLYEKYGFVKM